MKKVIYIKEIVQIMYSPVIVVSTTLGEFAMTTDKPLFAQFSLGLLRLAAQDNLPEPKCSKKAKVVPNTVVYSYSGEVKCVMPFTICFDGDGNPVEEYRTLTSAELEYLVNKRLEGWDGRSLTTRKITDFTGVFDVDAQATVKSFKTARTKKEWDKLTTEPW